MWDSAERMKQKRKKKSSKQEIDKMKDRGWEFELLKTEHILSNSDTTIQVRGQKQNMVRCALEVGNSQMKRYISAKARENSKHVKPKLLWMDFFESKCFQYGVNHCKTTFISCLCLSKEGWDTKLSRLVCSVQNSVQRGRCAHLRQGKAILKQLVVTLIGIVVWQPHGYWLEINGWQPEAFNPGFIL